MFVIRLCKISLVAATALFLALVVLNNLTDYGSNYAFVEGVLSMSTTFPGNDLMWRSIESPLIYTLFYWSIILWETVAMALCIWGTAALIKSLNARGDVFNRAKKFAAAGLTLSLLQWYVAFITVGGEWFLMWQSEDWNGQDAAFRMFGIIGITLVFLTLKDEDLEEAEKG